MNPWLLPGVALLVTGGWIVSGKRSAANLEREIEVLTARIRVAREAGDDASAAKGEKAAKEKDGKIDWKDLAGKISKSNMGGMGDMRAFMRMQKLLLELSPEELCAQLDEIEALDLEDRTRKQFRGMIYGMLVDKDPKLAVERMSAEMGDDESGVQWQIGMALGKWAKTDPAGATAWLDRQIAAGVFESKALDGKNENLIRIESALFGELFKSNPAAASARVAALPEDQRADFFRQSSYMIKSANDAEFAKLARENLKPEEASEVLANKTQMLALKGDFGKVDEYISRVNATEDEKRAIVGKTMESNLYKDGKVDAEALEKAYTWAVTQSPGGANESAGKAIGGSLWRGGKFEDASALALEYNARSGNDEVLAAFLKSDAVRNHSRKEALPMIDQIRDPALQAEIRALPQYKPKP